MTDETPYVSITRTFAASPEQVFEAWTNPSAVRALVRHGGHHRGGRPYGCARRR